MSQQPEAEKAYEKLRREHAKLDEQLQVLEERRWVSAAEEAEIKRLKKLKLQKKDEMRTLRPEA